MVYPCYIAAYPPDARGSSRKRDPPDSTVDVEIPMDFALFQGRPLLNTWGVTSLEPLALAGITVCAGASFYFALAESALFSLGKWRTQQLAEDSKEVGLEIARLLQEPQDLLATIVLGNTFANAGIIAVALWGGLVGKWSLGGAIAGALGLILIGGEVIPKTLAVRAPERWATRLVRSVVVLKSLTRPLRQVAQLINSSLIRALVPKSWKRQTTLTDEEYQELLEMAYQQGTLARSERDLILQIIRLDRRKATDVMKPRAQMACISDDLSIEEMVAAAKQFKHRRLPIFDETPDTIVGILNTRALLLDPQIDLAEAIEFPSFVPESMNLLQLFRSLQRQRRGLAMVLDEYGGTAGLITTEDILEEVVGEIHGEAETEGFALEKLGDGRWRVNGILRLDDFQREYPELGEVHGVDTMGGLVVAQLGVVPGQGESILFRGLRLTASVVDERRVREVMVEVQRKRGV
jgi:putative hemolysin